MLVMAGRVYLYIRWKSTASISSSTYPFFIMSVRSVILTFPGGDSRLFSILLALSSLVLLCDSSPLIAFSHAAPKGLKLQESQLVETHR